MAGGGIGEAMLIGAVTGAGTSAVTGGDPLKGALLGATGGGIGAGIAGAGTGAASGTTSGAAGGGASGAAGGVGAGGTTGVLSQTGQLTSGMVPSVSTGAATQTAGSSMFPSISKLYANNPTLFPAASGAFASALGAGPKPFEKEDDDYRGPLSDFSYSRSGYTPYRAASGGLMDSAVAKRMMKGGHLGSYSDGGRLLKGPGDGMSDDIPAKIGSKQPARLADGEFVIPADVVSGLGNGSTEAGARKLYAMMDKIRHARTGSKRQGREIDSRKYMPA